MQINLCLLFECEKGVEECAGKPSVKEAMLLNLNGEFATTHPCLSSPPALFLGGLTGKTADLLLKFPK